MNDEYPNTLLKYKLTEHESGKKAAPTDKKKNDKFSTIEEENEKNEETIPPNKKPTAEGLQLQIELVHDELQSLRDKISQLINYILTKHRTLY